MEQKQFIAVSTVWTDEEVDHIIEAYYTYCRQTEANAILNSTVDLILEDTQINPSWNTTLPTYLAESKPSSPLFEAVMERCQSELVCTIIEILHYLVDDLFNPNHKMRDKMLLK